MDLKKLNVACSVVTADNRKPVAKLQDLPQNTPEQILSAKLVQTKFGKSVLLELTEKVVFLPKRATEAFKPVIVQFDTGAYSVIYRDQKAIPGVPNLVCDFQIVQGN